MQLAGLTGGKLEILGIGEERRRSASVQKDSGLLFTDFSEQRGRVFIFFSTSRMDMLPHWLSKQCEIAPIHQSSDINRFRSNRLSHRNIMYGNLFPDILLYHILDSDLPDS